MFNKYGHAAFLTLLVLSSCGRGSVAPESGVSTISAPVSEPTPAAVATAAPTPPPHYVITEKEQEANTGIAYDSQRGEMISAAGNMDTGESFLVITDLHARELSRIDISGSIRYPQGVAYEAARDAIWVWGTRLDVAFKEWTDCFAIVVFDHAGREIERFNTPIADAYPGMIALTADGNVWLKANVQSTARLYNPHQGFQLLRELDTGIDGEGVALDSENRLWVHGEISGPHGACRVKSIDLATGETHEIDSPSPRCGAEGLAFDASGSLWISTDDLYHYQIPEGNGAWVLSPSNYQIR